MDLLHMGLYLYLAAPRDHLYSHLALQTVLSHVSHTNKYTHLWPVINVASGLNPAPVLILLAVESLHNK